jgi:hypothetical protein
VNMSVEDNLRASSDERDIERDETKLQEVIRGLRTLVSGKAHAILHSYCQ